MKPSQMAMVFMAACCLLTAGSVLAEDTPMPYVIVGGRKIPGTEVRADRRGQITLMTASGLMTFEPGTTVVMAEPPAFAGLRRLVEEGRPAEAIPGLIAIIEQYRFLGWDYHARRSLGRAQVGAGLFADAVKTFDDLFALQPTARAEAPVLTAYLRALEGAGEVEKLLPLLSEVIQEGARPAAALAQVMRGNLRLRDGDVEMALSDFLRTAMLFRAVHALQPEALYGTAVCYERLGLNDQAKPFYDQLIANHPKSEFAERARQR